MSQDIYYSAERNIQIVLSLFKQNGIKKVIASPGATNVSVVASMQQDPYFEIYSCVDERSAAYMACGLSEESGEPVVISCTGATSSREYMAGLTEAFYRKLPIIALTSSQFSSRIGQLVPQVTDRSCPPPDVVVASYNIESIKDKDDEWSCMIKVNKAISSLTKQGGGPVHINLVTSYCSDFSVKSLPKAHRIIRITQNDSFPSLPEGKIAVFCSSHRRWSKEETQILDNFCQSNNAVVICDHTSNYKGDYRVLPALIGTQINLDTKHLMPDLCIHIGEMSGAYPIFRFSGKDVWRVSEDGIIRDPFSKLSRIFEMPESVFFSHYIGKDRKNYYYEEFRKVYKELYDGIPEEIPFSNIWIAKELSNQLPEGSVLHLGILNSLRSWNLFEVPNSVREYSNVGGFGIDGNLSTLIGASLVDNTRLYFGVLGDLSTFYDINSLANRNVGKNIRVLVINNGRGAEFRLPNQINADFGDNIDKFIAAAGHNGNQSRTLLRNFVESLGYVYITACNKEEFNRVKDIFLNPKISESVIFEVFTDYHDECDALEMIKIIAKLDSKSTVKQAIKGVLGERSVSFIKKVIP